MMRPALVILVACPEFLQLLKKENERRKISTIIYSYAGYN